VVHTGELVTEVLGTSFTIKSYENAKAIEVLVRTGKVSVYERTKAENTRKNGVILTPNQKVILKEESKNYSKSSRRARCDSASVQPTQLIFEDAQLSQVLQRLKESYMIDFEIESDAFEHCVFTGDINDLPLHTQLNLVCKAVNASYEQRGTVIFLYGSGCK
jgi:type II secretory pathway component GspD/PulD (secretin)